METVTLNVNGMMCAHCQARVEKALTDAGARDVRVDLDAKTATCTYAAPLTVDALKQAVTDAGYEVA